MLYNLKKFLMSKAIGKRNRQNPFDYRFAESFSIEGISDPMVNNSYYFSAHGEEMSLFARLGRRAGVDEAWFALFVGGELYSLKQETFPSGQSPVVVEKNGDRWGVSFHGLLNESDQVAFDATFVATQRPVDFTSDMPAERMAAGIANEKWSRAFFGELQNVSGQCHYEQEGVLEGQMALNGRTYPFQLPCVRDHSFGRRDWNYMNNHLWLMAVSPSLQFNYSMVSYPVMTVLEVGNCRDENGQRYLRRADLDLRQVSLGTVPRELSLNVDLDDGRRMHVLSKPLAGVTYHFQNGQYVLHENVAEFVIDGKNCRGIMEIGFNGDRSRYFNQKDLKNIKR